jgi:hypothetical protein
MPLFDCDAVAQAANADREFKLAARFWNADLRLAADDETYLMRIRDGLIAAFTPISRAEAAKTASEVQITGSRGGWRELLRPVPKPFFQDLMSAVTRENFQLEGDLIGFYPYYRATCRLLEIMRTIPSMQGGDHAAL